MYRQLEDRTQSDHEDGRDGFPKTQCAQALIGSRPNAPGVPLRDSHKAFPTRADGFPKLHDLRSLHFAAKRERQADCHAVAFGNIHLTPLLRRARRGLQLAPGDRARPNRKLELPADSLQALLLLRCDNLCRKQNRRHQRVSRAPRAPQAFHLALPLPASSTPADAIRKRWRHQTNSERVLSDRARRLFRRVEWKIPAYRFDSFNLASRY